MNSTEVSSLTAHNKPLSFSKRDTPALGRWKAYFYRRPKDNEAKRLRIRRTMSMNLFSDSRQSMEELLRKSKKVKREATLEEAEIDGAWLTAYARIARRCRGDKDLGVSRYPYELAPDVSPFSGGCFECSAARTNVVFTNSYVDDYSSLIVSSLPLYFYTMTSHRNIYIYKC
jgi:hypothetical protein